MQKAKWAQKKQNDFICGCCPHYCRIPHNKTGICGTYLHAGDQLWNQRYSCFSSICIDPIEKKPLHHFYPGESILSLGGYGCNLTCFYCQNHSISQNQSIGEFLPSEEIISKAIQHHCIGVALTYNEPLVNIETALDLFYQCHQKNLQTVLVTNGYINEQPLQEIVPLVDAVNIDIKFSNDPDYQKYTGGHLEPIVNALRIFHKNCLTEISYLVIPTINDSPSAIQDFCSIVTSVDCSIPVHFNAYTPHWKAAIEPTPPEEIQRICYQAKESLQFVYGGNLPSSFDPELTNTFCPKCHTLWIERNHQQIRIRNITNQKCSICGETIKNIKGIES